MSEMFRQCRHPFQPYCFFFTWLAVSNKFVDDNPFHISVLYYFKCVTNLECSLVDVASSSCGVGGFVLDTSDCKYFEENGPFPDLTSQREPL